MSVHGTGAARQDSCVSRPFPFSALHSVVVSGSGSAGADGKQEHKSDGAAILLADSKSDKPGVFKYDLPVTAQQLFETNLLAKE